MKMKFFAQICKIYRQNIYNWCKMQSMGEGLKDYKNLLSDFNFENLAKIANVEVKLTAQLGTSRAKIKDILRYDEGSLIVLDNYEDEPVDIFVDSVLVARGEVVAVGDSYGVKVVELIKNKEKEEE